MTDAELIDALDGLFAFDSGAICSGVKDELLRAKVIVELAKDVGAYALFGSRVSRIAREMFLSDEALALGYGLEDIRGFTNWLDERMR